MFTEIWRIHASKIYTINDLLSNYSIPNVLINDTRDIDIFIILGNTLVIEL